MMDIHPGLMIWTIISFVILLIVLNRFAWKPILKALDEREQGIKNDIAAAQDARAKAESSLGEYHRKIAEAHSEAQALLTKARQDAERINEELLAKAKRDAEQTVERARRQIDAERQEAVNQIRAEMADLVVMSAERIIGRAINPDDHKRLALDSLNDPRT